MGKYANFYGFKVPSFGFYSYTEKTSFHKYDGLLSPLIWSSTGSDVRAWEYSLRKGIKSLCYIGSYHNDL